MWGFALHGLVNGWRESWHDERRAFGTVGVYVPGRSGTTPAPSGVGNVLGATSARAFSLLEQREGRVGEEADGPVLRALGRVLGDLASIGYDAQWGVVPACAVGAPHKRARVFLTGG